MDKSWADLDGPPFGAEAPRRFGIERTSTTGIDSALGRDLPTEDDSSINGLISD